MEGGGRQRFDPIEQLFMEDMTQGNVGKGSCITLKGWWKAVVATQGTAVVNGSGGNTRNGDEKQWWQHKERR